MLKKQIVPIMIAVIAATNRFATKLIPIGGIFEITILLSIALKPYTTARMLKKHYPALLLIIYTVAILSIETIEHGISSLPLRRAALGLYAITPIILLAYRNEISAFLGKRLKSLGLLILTVALVNPPNFQPTMAAQLSGALLVFSLIYKKDKISSAIFGITYLLLTSGITSGQSVYRTPLVTVLLALAIIYLPFFSGKLIKRGVLIKFTAGVAASLVLLGTGALNKPLGSVLIGVSGLIDSNSLHKTSVSLGADAGSTRGDAAGTAKTRKIFWDSIIEYQSSHTSSLIFGYGLQHGFMEVALPNMPFKDKDLIDPHNSYINIFFRFGIIGFILYIWLIAKVSLHVVAASSRQNAIPFFCISYLFAFFEVALENPHGNLIFWLILLMPILIGEKSEKQKWNPNQSSPGAQQVQIHQSLGRKSSF